MSECSNGSTVDCSGYESCDELLSDNDICVIPRDNSTSMSVDEYSMVKVFGEVCKKAIHSLLGESGGSAILVLLHRDLSRDPFEILWENPKAFCQAVERIFGVGSRALMRLLVTNVIRESGLDVNSERLLELMECDDQYSLNEVRLILRKIAELISKRC